MPIFYVKMTTSEGGDLDILSWDRAVSVKDRDEIFVSFGSIVSPFICLFIADDSYVPQYAAELNIFFINS